MALGPGFPIIIQSGISAGAPSTVGNLPMFAGGAPPDILVDSLLREVAGPPVAIIVGATDPEPTSLATFRTTGGIVSESTGEDSLVLGSGAFAGPALSAQSIALGFGASLGASGGALNDSVVVGGSSVVTSPTLATGGFQSAIVVLGPRNTVSSAGGQPANYLTIIGGGNAYAAPLGGTNGNCIMIGHFITASTPLDVVCVGSSLAMPAQYSNAVHVGNSQQAGGGIGHVVLGSGCNVQGGSDNILIGRNALKQGAVGGDQNVIIGALAKSSVDYAVVIGALAECVGSTGNICIGRDGSVAFANAGGIAPGVTPSAAGQFVIGSNFTGGQYDTFIFSGRGPIDSAPIANVTWRITDQDTGAGNNRAAGNLVIRSGLGTGNAASGSIDLAVGEVGASGATLQTQRTVLSVRPIDASDAIVALDSPGTKSIAIRISQAASIKGYIGSPGAAGNLTLNSAVGDIVLRSQGGRFMFSTDGGASTQFRLLASGGGAGQPVMAFANINTAPGASAGTITNAKSAGNPTDWIPVEVNGNVRYIPAWT